MSMKPEKIKELLDAHQFGELFNKIGWDWPDSDTPHGVQIGEQRFDLIPVAHKRGFMAYHCPQMPDPAMRGKIETRLSRDVREHLIIFTGDHQHQRWHWVRRAPGQPLARREHEYLPNQPLLLIEKLRWLEVAIDDEENLIITDVADKVQSAFDVDKVTKRFYERFKKEHDAFLSFIEGIADMGDAKWYASVMLNRLMFIYFIQKKGFLDGDTDYLRNRLARVQALKGKDRFHTFYRYFLMKLCHEVLAKKDRTLDKDLAALIGQVPYLNGGIFQPHELEVKYGEAISISDDAFQQVFDFFDQYEWHLDNRTVAKANEINPDVLGYIFEKYINQKQMGAYYTKEDITEYISKNTIIPCLFDKAQKACKIAFEGETAVWNLLQADPDRYIYPAVRHGVSYDINREVELSAPVPVPPEIAIGLDTDQPDLLERRKDWNTPAPPEAGLPTEIWRETVARRQRYADVRGKLERGEVRAINDLITLNLDIRQFAQDVIEQAESPDLLNAFWVAIAGRMPQKSDDDIKAGISVLDPTCGSGAFLFAALNVLEPLYEACLKRMDAFLREWGDHSRHKNYAAFFRTILGDIDKHPSPQYFIYKSIIVQNLYGVDLMKEAVEICKLRLFLKLVAQVDDGARIEPLPDIDFNIRAGNTLVGFATADEMKRAMQGDLLAYATVLPEILEQAEDCDRHFNLFRKAQLEGDISLPKAKKTLRDKLTTLNKRLNCYLAEDYGIPVAATAGRGKSDLRSPTSDLSHFLETHQPFHWFIEFYGIINSGGFDAIIGNPPYVEMKNVDEYRVANYTTIDTGNLYALCLERSRSLLAKAGHLGVIVPLSGFSTERMQDYQECIWRGFHSLAVSFYSGDAHPSVLFDGVKYRLCIIIGSNTTESSRENRVSDYIRWYADERLNLFASKIYHAPCDGQSGSLRFAKTGTRLANQILAKLLSKKSTLSTYLRKVDTGHITYHRSPVFWIRSMDFEPYFKSSVKDRSTDHLKDLYFENSSQAKLAGAMLNSTLFYFWFTVQGNCRNIAGPDIERFPVGDLDSPALKELSHAFVMLMEDLKSHSKRRTYVYKASGTVEYDEFYPSASKPIIDEIDKVLARHYGFTEEELDYIINYDIKYRMGKDLQEDEE